MLKSRKNKCVKITDQNNKESDYQETRKASRYTYSSWGPMLFCQN